VRNSPVQLQKRDICRLCTACLLILVLCLLIRVTKLLLMFYSCQVPAICYCTQKLPTSDSRAKPFCPIAWSSVKESLLFFSSERNFFFLKRAYSWSSSKNLFVLKRNRTEKLWCEKSQSICAVTPHPRYTCTVTYPDFWSIFFILFYLLLFEYLLI